MTITDCLSDDCSLNNRTLDMVNDVGLIREVNFMQSLLSQQEQKEEQLDIPVTDAVMEATREINMDKAYPQDVTLSTSPRDSGVVSDICPTHVSLQGSICHSLWGERCGKSFFQKRLPSIQL